MSTPTTPPIPKSDSRTRLLDASVSVIRSKGYSATTVDDLCAEAGVSKGAFFHHFASKEALGAAAARHWAATTAAHFAGADYHRAPSPFERVLGYLALRRAQLQGDVAEFTCLAGTMVSEVHATSPDIRHASERAIFGHAETLEADIEAAMLEAGLDAPWTARSLALHTQAVLQGAFVLAKAQGSPGPAVESLDHLARYIRLLLNSGAPEQTSRTGKDT